MNRQPEVEQIPAAIHYGLGVVPYSPLARGVLTAKYRPGEAPEAGSRAARQDKRMLETELRPESIEIAQTIRTHAESVGTTAAHFAIGWVLANPLITGTIVGPRTEAHLDDYLAALAYRFTAADEALVDGLVLTRASLDAGLQRPAIRHRGAGDGQLALDQGDVEQPLEHLRLLRPGDGAAAGDDEAGHAVDAEAMRPEVVGMDRLHLRHRRQEAAGEGRRPAPGARRWRPGHGGRRYRRPR